ncbi:hypothetical protein HKD37_09G025570 [Glycine soja]
MEMDKDKWIYDNIMSEEVNMNIDNGEELGVFATRDDVLHCAHSIAYDIGFVAMVMKSGKYRAYKKDLVRTITSSRKCGCHFKLRSMVKPKNILLVLKEHNTTSCATMKQVYNARYTYHSSIRGHNSEMQQLMKLLECDQYIHWHRLKNEDVVRDIFWSHLDVVKLTSVCNLVESAYWALKRLLQNSLRDLCSVWEAMITLQHTEIKASFETSTHVVGHVFKVTLYKKLIGMVSRYALNQIAAKFERVNYVDIYNSRCGCIMRTTHGLPCVCELARYVLGSISLDTIHMFWWKRSFLDQGLSEPEVNITKKIEVISKWFEELDVCGKVTLKSAQKKQISKQQRSTKRYPSYWEYVDALHEDSWSLVRNHLLKELAQSDEYMHLLGGIDRYKELKRSLLISMVTMDKWMNITDMGYVIASRYNVILVSISLQQRITFFPLRSQPPRDSFVHHIICIGHVYDNHFVQIKQ